MKKIEQILGPETYARLKEKKLVTPAAIKKIRPEELMSIAGIGPQKTVELYQAVGIKLNMDETDRTYRKLKSRTQLRNIRKTISQTIQDPQPSIKKLENFREQAIAWQNLISSLRNIGKPAEEKIRTTPYMPVPQVLDPYSIELEQKTRDDIYAELFITQETDRIKITYEAKDIKTQRPIAESTEYITSKNSTEIATQIKEIIEEIYNKFRKETLIGLFFVIFDNQLRTYYWAMQKEFRIEIEQQQITLIPNSEEYYGWEAILKYQNNRTFELMVDRYNKYKTYIDYDEYLQEGGTETYENWLSEGHTDKRFWDEITTKQKSHTTIQTKTFTIRFGIIKGMPGLINYEKTHREINLTTKFYRDTGYESYTAAKRDLQGEINAVAAAIINNVLDEFIALKKENNYVFQSTTLPEIGIQYETR